MTLSIWRYAHLALAILSSIFLLILSITGVILAADAVIQKKSAYQIKGIDEMPLANTLPDLWEKYPEMVELNVDHNKYVWIEAFDDDGNNILSYIDPTTGEVLGEVKPQSDFIRWTIALHRSLFLKQTGRIIVGIVSFLLLLITISGVVLIIKRQKGILKFFSKINRDFFAQYFHVVSGRLLLIPILILALTGTYLFMLRIEWVKSTSTVVDHEVNEDDTQIELDEFPIFQETMLSEIEKVEFPIFEDDPEEFFVVKKRARILTINQINGEIAKETTYPYTATWEKLSLDLHTGRTSVIWAIILGIASLNIIFFIYSGFAITFRRTKTKVRNKFSSDQAEIVLLFGSENGSTLSFADQVHRQLLGAGFRSHITAMDQYKVFPNAQKLIVFTATHGLGDPPSNAVRFERLLSQYAQPHKIEFSVLGFGSRAYEDFCGYAKKVDSLLENRTDFVRTTDLKLVNDRSAVEIVDWVQGWNEKTGMAIPNSTALYQLKPSGTSKWKVISKTDISENELTFKVLLKPTSRRKFQSGDLLSIYPADDHRERFYSIGMSGNAIQLLVKFHPGGLGSEYLSNLQVGKTIRARLVENPHFHFPKKAPAVALIANGTGIAPFLGMIDANRKKIETHLFAGFRHDNALTEQYRVFGQENINKGRLRSIRFAFSREEKSQYVMDLIHENCEVFVSLLEKGGFLMICGSLTMQKNVEETLNICLQDALGKGISHFSEQILTDCY